MAGRNGNKKSTAGFGLVGAGASVFFAAAALATSSASPARADFEDLLDPIIQPMLTSLTDSVAAFDPSAAADVASWSDSVLSAINSIDVAQPGVESASAAAATGTVDSPTTGVYDIPLGLQNGNELSAYASIDGGSPTNLLVDTNYSGLVVPFTNFDGNSYNFFTELEHLYDLGVPVGLGESSYGGVDYLYLTYDGVSVDYTALTNGQVNDLITNTPVEMEVYSWDPSNLGTLSSNDAFQNLLTGDQVSGIMGIGQGTSESAGVSPLAGAGFTGVTVDDTPFALGGGLIVDDNNPFTAIATLPSVGSTPTSDLYETVSNILGQNPVGTTVSDTIDSGGGYGTIPASLAGDVAPGSLITVYTSQGGTELYQYLVGDNEVPATASGSAIDSGVVPFFTEPIYLNYANDSVTFDEPQPGDLPPF
ncbi:hypothetical protein [Mycobacterium sp.]|uniref:hypothetical protein n=1 Tax=Mycobacterium sp. TaxID=1785 RepID=UPI003BAFACD9